MFEVIMDIDFDLEMGKSDDIKLNMVCWVLFECIWEEIWIVVLDYLGLLFVDKLIVRNFICLESWVLCLIRVMLKLLKSFSDVGVYEYKW